MVRYFLLLCGIVLALVLVTPLLPVFVLLVFAVTVFLSLVNIPVNWKYQLYTSRKDFTELENVMVANCDAYDVTYVQSTVNVAGENWNVRTCVMTSRHPQSQTFSDLVLLHGAASGAMVWEPSWKRMSSKYRRIFALNIPGFGRTKTPNNLNRMKTSTVDSDALMVEFITKYFVVLGITDPPFLFGHSFGAYIAVLFADQHPERIAGLVLADAAGIFPTLGDTGSYWGIYFKYSPIQGLLRKLGFLGQWVAFTWFDAIRCRSSVYYWFMLLANRDAIGDTLVGTHISLTYTGSCHWNSPVLHLLLGLRCPVSFIYGEHDAIMPVHQGLILMRILDCDARCFIVPNVGHNPLDPSNPDPFVEAVSGACAAAVRPGNGALGNHLTKPCLSKYTSSLNLKHTRDRIQMLYADLDTAVVKRVCGRFVFISRPEIEIPVRSSGNIVSPEFLRDAFVCETDSI